MSVLLAPPSGTVSAQEPQCVPDCRAGDFCREGQCVSKCNPPCAAGETCTDEGACQTSTARAPTIDQPATDQSAAMVQPAAAEPPSPAPSTSTLKSPDLATAGGVVGIGGVGLYALGWVVMATVPDPAVFSFFFVSGDSLLIAGPLTSAVLADGSRGPASPGSLGLRITGWFLYGISGTATALKRLGVTFPSWNAPLPFLWLTAAFTGVGAMGCFAIDAFITASQAKSARQRAVAGAERRILLPSVGFTRDVKGDLAPTLSLVGTL